MVSAEYVDGTFESSSKGLNLTESISSIFCSEKQKDSQKTIKMSKKNCFFLNKPANNS